MCPPHHHSGHLHFRLHLASHRSCSLLSHIYSFILRQNLAANSICDFGHLVDAAQCPHPFLSLHIPEFPPLATYTPHSWRCFPWFRPTPCTERFPPHSPQIPTWSRVPRHCRSLFTEELAFHASSAVHVLFPTLTLKHPHVVHMAVQMLSSGHGDPLLSVVWHSYPDPLSRALIPCVWPLLPLPLLRMPCPELDTDLHVSVLSHRAPSSAHLGSSTLAEKSQCPMGTVLSVPGSGSHLSHYPRGLFLLC